MRLAIDKDRFKELLTQFKDDVPYEVSLIKMLMDQLPNQVASNVIEEMYFRFLYTGEVYMLQHCNFSTDIHYFTNIDMVKKFLIEISLEDPEYLESLTKRTITRYMTDKQPICGYYISLGEINDGNREKYFNATSEHS